jgi:hypothetical protein
MEYSSSLVRRSTARVGETVLRKKSQEPEIAEYDGEITKIDTDRSQLITYIELSVMRVVDIITVLSLALSTSAKLETEGIRLPLPTRELEWKDVNIISISDSHGTLPFPTESS